MKIAIAIATAVVLFASISGVSAQNLPGKFEGKNLDGSAYSRTAEIVATSETTCRIRWQGSTTATASRRATSWANRSASSSRR